MEASELLIRDALENDLPAILGIYNEAVLTTTAVWNEVPRSIAAQQRWFDEKRAASLPVLAALVDGEVVGFCSYGPFRPWYGYRFTVESSVYVATEQRRRGIARRLLAALVERARSQGLHAMVAGIEAQNVASLRLHETLGFTTAAHLHEVGFKFDRWLDLVLMELRL